MPPGVCMETVIDAAIKKQLLVLKNAKITCTLYHQVLQWRLIVWNFFSSFGKKPPTIHCSINCEVRKVMRLFTSQALDRRKKSQMKRDI